jgi:phosphopantothenoylcysteine decarboxylase/phosphopantothenate--cysteine ligase
MLQGKKILLGVTGSIAAYKSATLIRLLVKAGAEVKVVMTKAAADFIPALTLSTLSKNNVLTDLFEANTWANHVMLGRWADVMLIAPASCNTIAKMATGACDNLLLATYLSATCPVWVAPAMDEDMWNHPATRQNLDKLSTYGNYIIPVDKGELASGLSGEGRMAEPEAIIGILDAFFNVQKDLSDKKILISAGPTHEALDPVRFISNHSTGKMGIALANECSSRGAEVTLVLGPSSEKIQGNMQVIRVTSAAQMLDACVQHFTSADIAIMCAAVADYTPVNVAQEKIKKSETVFTLELQKTADILKTLGAQKAAGQVLVGFALETEQEKANAIKKLDSKNADFIVLNSLKDEGAGFGHSTNKITIFDRQGNEFSFDKKAKEDVATDIINTIITDTNA